MQVSFRGAVLAFAVFALCGASASAQVAQGGPGDQPAVAVEKVRVHVSGRVKTPGIVELDAGARLSDALNASGAFAFETLVARVGGTPVPDTACMLGGPNLRTVVLIRTTAASRPVFSMIDVSLARQQHDLRYDPLLKANDKIVVPECPPKVKIISTPPMFPTPAP